MKTEKINIDFQVLSKTFGQFVREKAARANSNIIYQVGNQLIKENPRTGEKKVLKEYN